MIKVLNIISDTNIGGAGRVLVNYLKYRDASQFDVSVALPVGSRLRELIEPFGVRIYELEGIADKSLDLGAIRELKGVIRREDPDIVHTHGALSGRIAARECGKIVIFTRHSAFTVKSYLRHGPLKLASKLVNEHYADRIIAVSPAAAENLTDMGVSAEKIDIVMNGVDPLRSVSCEERSALRERLGIGEQEFTAGIAARIEEYKGHADILRAVRRILDSGRSMKLLIAGCGSYEGEVRRLTEELGIKDNVIFMGFVEDVAPVWGISDVQINASWAEATSLALLEGFSAGVPAVVSDFGGNPYVMEDGVNGLIFKTRDVEDLAEKLTTLIDRPEKLREMREGSRRIYSERFTAEIFARSTERIYTQAMEDRSHERR